MNTIYRTFLKLIKSHLNNEEPDIDYEVDLMEVFNLACKHNLLPLVYDAASSLVFDGKESIRNQALLQMINQTKRTYGFLKIYNYLVQNGLRPLVLKGLVARSLYTSPDLRISADEDIYIRREDYELCSRLLIQYGCKMDERCSNRNPNDAQAITYMCPDSELCIEVHLNPFGLSGVRKELNKYFEDSFERCIALEIEGCEIFTLSHTDHFLFLFLHLYKHLINYGVGLRQCMDMTLYAERYTDQICWERIIDVVRQLGCEQLLYCILEIGSKDLSVDFDISDIPFDKAMNVTDRSGLLIDMIEGGVFGKSSNGRVFSGPVVQISSLKRKKGNVVIGFLKACFPSKEYLKYSYPILQEHTIMLPFVWIYRIIRYIKRTKEPKLAEGLKVARKRLALLEEYGLVN